MIMYNNKKSPVRGNTDPEQEKVYGIFVNGNYLNMEKKKIDYLLGATPQARSKYFITDDGCIALKSSSAGSRQDAVDLLRMVLKAGLKPAPSLVNSGHF